jgi:hypothetical protein
VVHWDVEVTNQHDEPVAVYTILTLVRRQAGAGMTASDMGGEVTAPGSARSTLS